MDLEEALRQAKESYNRWGQNLKEVEEKSKQRAEQSKRQNSLQEVGSDEGPDNKR
ncbi:MAG: hypothetical protein K0S20_144 [Patescibacteria group bacterium]|jgi:hypothetical protein|nr:hypothetical protein [Patescibacteria group bacterium]